MNGPEIKRYQFQHAFEIPLTDREIFEAVDKAQATGFEQLPVQYFEDWMYPRMYPERN